MKDRRFRISERAIYGVMGWVCGMALGLLLYFERVSSHVHAARGHGPGHLVR
jgi:hypothetical protein